MNYVYPATALTGGGTGALDSISGAGLADKDMAIVVASGTAYIYILDEDSGASESSPTCIAPDTSPGDKRWILQSIAQSTINLTGGQIQFPATAVASSDANTLDDYEEGTWTPAITFGGGATGVTYSANNGGRYTKIGNMIFISGCLILTSKGTSTGSALITGLPFTVRAGSLSAIAPVSLSPAYVKFANQMFGYCTINTTTISLQEETEAGATTALTDTDFANNSNIAIMAVYRDA